MSDDKYKCSVCKEYFDGHNIYEYRGAYACGEHHDQAIKNRDYERQQIIDEEDRKTKVFKGLDLSDSVVGKGNQELLKAQIEIAKKESYRLKKYEGR